MRFRTYSTIKALRANETVEVNGIKFVMDGDGTITDGDMYIAERNSVQLLTAARVDEDGYIIPTTSAYCFDLHECVKVKEG